MIRQPIKNSQRELLSKASPVLALGLEAVEQRQLNDIGPIGRARRATCPTYQLQLGKFLLGLKDGFLSKELPEDAPGNRNRCKTQIWLCK